MVEEIALAPVVIQNHDDIENEREKHHMVIR